MKITLRESILNLFYNDKNASKFLKDLENDFEVVIFGGTVRDFVFLNQFSPRDIDIVLVPKSQIIVTDDFLSQYYKKDKISRNQFGGYKLQNKYVNFDVWLISNTWAFKHKLLDTNIENLLKSVYLNIDAYAYSFNRNKYISDCNKNEFPKQIDIILESNPNLALNFIRALSFSRKYQLGLSEKLIISIITEIKNDENFPNSWIEIQQKHFGYITFNDEELLRIVSLIKMEGKVC